jgi:c-di-GMP-binding flagellar brake protein YcgR
VADTDVERPEVSTRADVALVTRGITVTAAVDSSDDAGLAVRPVGTAAAWRASVRIGDRVDVYWTCGVEERTLPATVASVEGMPEPVWRLRLTGPPARSQRREAVRGRVELPVALQWPGGSLHGSSVDLSEGGTRVLVQAVGTPPEPGTPVAATLTLEEGISLDLESEVVWHDVGGPTWLVAMRFVRVSDDDRDTLRRRVFRALREERASIGG